MRSAVLLAALAVVAVVAYLATRRQPPCREQEAYQAGRLAGFEDGIQADPYQWLVLGGEA